MAEPLKNHFGESVVLAQRTTRRHHPGRHRIEALVNGRPVPVGHVDLVAG